MWTKFNSACYLINDEIMIDFPNGACKYLYRLGINPINVNIYFVIVLLDIGRKSHQGIDNYKSFVDNYNSVLEDKKKKKKLMTPQEIIATNSYHLK